jgi:ABC-2 type transport system ATP-binding protein
MPENVIETHGLTVFYGRHRGIIDLDLAVKEGEVFGFLGPNGAGKTTAMRVLLDIIRPTQGKATVFGMDCQQQSVDIRRRAGYMPGELSFYGDMSGRRFLDMFSQLRGDTSDPSYRREICERLQFDPSRTIREYSSGNRRKLGLIMAFMHQPDLLIVDEPTLGLDPLVVQTVLRLLNEARDEGRTVFMSSHVLSEVQSVCDRVGIIREGRLVEVGEVDALTAQPFHRLRLVLREEPPEDAFSYRGVAEKGRIDHEVQLEVRQNLEAVLEEALSYGTTDIETHPATLEEVFLAYYGENGEDNG